MIQLDQWYKMTLLFKKFIKNKLHYFQIERMDINELDKIG